MRRLLFLLPLVLLFIGCKEKHYFTNVTCGETYLAHIVFEDESFRDRFLLPGGSTPFIAAREMPQP